MKRQRVEKLKLVEVSGVKKWEVEKIWNKQKVRGVIKYLVRRKGFIIENNTWKKEKDLKNTKELIDKFEERMEAEVRRQERIEKI